MSFSLDLLIPLNPEDPDIFADINDVSVIPLNLMAKVIEKKHLTIDIYSKQELDQNLAIGLVFKALIDLNLNFISNITISSYMSSYMAEKSSYIWSYEFASVNSMKDFNNSTVLGTDDLSYELKFQHPNPSQINESRNTLIKLANNGDMSAVSKLCYLEFTQDDLNISSPKIDIITRMDDGNVLRINIRCHEKIEQNIVVNSIYKAIVDLDFNNITNIMISIYAFSNMNPTWMREFTSIQLLQKFCDSKSNNQQYNLPISSDNDSNSVAKRSIFQTDQSIQTDNMKNNNIALIISIIFGVFGGLIVVYGLLNYFGLFRPSRSDTNPVEELSQIKSLLLIFLPLFFAFQIDILARLRK